MNSIVLDMTSCPPPRIMTVKDEVRRDVVRWGYLVADELNEFIRRGVDLGAVSCVASDQVNSYNTALAPW